MGEDLGEESVAQRTKKRNLNNPETDVFIDGETDECGSVDSDEGSNDDFQPPTKKKNTKSGYKKKKKYSHGPRVALPGGKVSRRRPGARVYNSRKEMVLNFPVVRALNYIFDNKDNMIRLAGQGYDHDGIRYAQFYGHLKRGGEPVLLRNIILSSDKKVYQMVKPGEHYELFWQNDKDEVKRSYGTIKFPQEGGSAQISLKMPFLRELSVDI